MSEFWWQSRHWRRRPFRFLQKWGWCWWKHRDQRYYCEVWKVELGNWHCGKCHPCNEGMIEISQHVEVEMVKEIIRRRDGDFELHPTALCPVCGARLMLGNPKDGEWHCSKLVAYKGKEDARLFLKHYARSQLMSQNTA